jgi:hypothetical protein
MMTAKLRISRRSILKSGALAAAAGFPTIVPSSVFGQNAPSNRITVGAIGVGRISRSHDLAAIRKYDGARVIAVCDLDANRGPGGIRRFAPMLKRLYSQNSGFLLTSR